MSAQRSIPAWATSLVAVSALMVSAPSSWAQGTKAAPVATQEKVKAKAKAAAKEIDLNSATSEELMTLPGVGEATSEKIIAGRPYKAVDDLAKSGVPAATIAKIKPLAVVHPLPEAVDVNTASAERLETLPGVGPALAKAIMADRPYKTFDDLAKVKGLGPAKLKELRGRVEFGKAGSAVEKVKTAVKEKADTAKDTLSTVKEKAGEKAGTVKEKMAKGVTAGREKAAETIKPKLAPGQKVNINTASLTELDELFGIGKVRAQAIIDGRPYKSIEDIMKVKGIKEGEFSKIKDNITVK